MLNKTALAGQVIEEIFAVILNELAPKPEENLEVAPTWIIMDHILVVC
jgi:hypothetical protein